MAVDIGQIISSALGGAESSFARKEQRLNLAEARRRNTRKELNNRAINSGLYTLDDTGNFHVDIKKAYESPESRALLLDIINTSGSGAANYKDLNNQIKNGKFADLPKVVDAGDGTANFIGEIEKEDGSIQPLTENRTSSPNDNPALIDAASLELLAESAMLNSMGEFGIDGTAVAVLENLNFNSPTVKGQVAAVNALREEKDPAALTNLIAQLGPTIKQTDPNRGNVTVDDLGGKAATLNQTATSEPIKGRPTGFAVLDTSQKEVQDALPFINNIKAGQSYSEEEIDQLSKGLSPGFRTAFKKKFSFNSRLLEKNANEISELEAIEDKSPKQERDLAKLKRRRESYLIPQQQKQIDRVRQNVADDTKAQQDADIKATESARKQLEAKQKLLDNPNISEGRRKELEAEINQLGGVGADDFNLGFDVSEIPTDIEGATAWFSNKANTDAIEQLDPDKVAKVREFLEDKNINSKKELVDAVKQGEVSFNQARNIARITAWSVVDKNGQKDAQLSANIYSGFINEMQTGNPVVTPTQMANAQTSRNNADLAKARYLDDLRQAGFSDIEEAYKSLGETGTPLTDDFTQKMKVLELKLFPEGSKSLQNLTDQQKQGIDGLLSQFFIKKSEEVGPENLSDAIGDFFLRSPADITLGNLMDNLVLIRDKPREEGGKPIRIVFTHNIGGKRAFADQSLDWNEVTKSLPGAMANVFESRLQEGTQKRD